MLIEATAGLLTVFGCYFVLKIVFNLALALFQKNETKKMFKS